MLAPELVELAEAYGIATEFWDWRHVHRPVSERTVVAVLAALGVDASTPDAVRAALADRRLTEQRRPLPPVVVCRQGTGAHVRVPAGDGADLEVRFEDGTVLRDLALDEHGCVLPRDLPLGWHTIVLTLDGREVTTPLAVTPDFLGVPGHARHLRGPGSSPERYWGLMTQLYSVRSARSWGIGDLADLGELVRWSAGYGADLAIVNPLHATTPVPPLEPSPYFPATRRFPSPLYLRVEDVPEYASLDAADRARVDELAAPLRRADTDPGTIDRDACWLAKRAALEVLFRAGTSDARRAAYDAFVEREGGPLTDFATWNALAEEHGARWRDWPAKLCDPRSPAVDAERRRLAERVEFHRWLQWLLDEQLGAVQHTARDAGMALGVVHDLAVGVSPEGADAWAMQDVLALGVTVGAPPDAFNQRGQDWRQPPWHPVRLAEAGYAPYRDMVRALLRHAGGVRVDHVIGLFRLWWIPAGGSAFDGAYVRYDHEAMVGILALEAHRAGAVVVGEDLGTVEPSARAYLAERGILGTSVLWFEHDHDAGGGPLPPQRWRELCLATVTTHDLPPTAGYLTGAHVELRERLGLLTRPVEEVRAADRAEREAWLAALRAAGLLEDGDADDEDVIAALHAYVARTPSRLMGVALSDAVGDRRTQNQPGTVDEYPNWRVPLTDGQGRPVLVEDVVRSPRADRLLRLVAASVRGAHAS
ncbi:MAG: 4-alpha-glucanotransferase [Streptosporangiales bacterium]|nr:4-alpha-glucanotransferase [Streptosporangiales bacterium]MBO0890796.1 4-alpha-glucanotransferase [Acidothermales bacterium]